MSSVAAIAPAAASADGGCAGGGVEVTAQGAPPFRAVDGVPAQRATRREGLHTLTVAPDLSRAAADFSSDMVRESFFRHRAPAGPDLAGRLTRGGYLGPAATDWIVGENLAWARGSAATPYGLVAAWMESPGHRHNVLEPAFRTSASASPPACPGPAPTA